MLMIILDGKRMLVKDGNLRAIRYQNIQIYQISLFYLLVSDCFDDFYRIHFTVFMISNNEVIELP